MEEKKDTHTTDYSAIPAISATTERIAEATNWESLERVWKVLQKLPEDAPEWENFWKSLDDWARDNINQGALPKVEWNRMQVAAWARKVLNFSEQSAKILIDKEIAGAALPLVPSDDWLEKKGIAPGAALRLWAEIEKMKKSLAEPGVGRSRTASEAGLDEKGYTKRGKYTFRIVEETPEIRRIEPHAFENREKEMEQFIQLSLTNLKEVQSPTPNNLKIQLAVASQMLGSGKTWFGRFLLDSARRNREKLLKKFDQKDVDYFLSAHYVGIDLRDLEGSEFSVITLKTLFLKRLIRQCPEHKFQEAKQFWNDKDIGGYLLEDLAQWFVQLLKVPLFFHFDEVDAINAKLNIKQTFEPDEERVHNYYHFWNLIHPLHKRGFLYLSGRTPHLFYLGKQFHRGMEQSPSNTMHFFFDRLLKSNVKNLLQSQIGANNLKLEHLDVDNLAKMICTATAGVPRFVTWAIDYLKSCDSTPVDYTTFLESLYEYINVPARGEHELFAYKIIPEEAKDLYIQLVFDSVLEIPYGEKDYAISQAFNLDNVSILKIIWQLGLFTGKRPLSDLNGEDGTSLHSSGIVTSSPQPHNRSDYVFIIVPPLVAKALSNSRLQKTVLFGSIVAELESNQAYHEGSEWLETIAKQCLRYRLASGPRKIEPNKQLHALLPLLQDSQLPNITVRFKSGDIHCLPKFTAKRNIKLDDKKIKNIQQVLLSTEQQRNDQNKQQQGTFTLQPEVNVNDWNEVIKLIEPGMYSPAKKSCSGDFYIVIDDPETPGKLFMLIFQYKSGCKTTYSINDIATEAFKCFDINLLEATQNKSGNTTKFISNIALILVGGTYDLKVEDYVKHSYAFKVTQTNMTNSKQKGKVYSEKDWICPNNLEIFVLTDAGLKQLLSPYNVNAADVQS